MADEMADPRYASHPLSTYKAASGHFEPVWTLEIQAPADDVDKILDAAVAVYPLQYGRYERNASVSAVGVETARPCSGSTTTTHLDDFVIGSVESFPVVEIKISIERDPDVLAAVMDAVMHVHHYEEPVIFLREDWASRATYNPNNNNPHRWWNNGRGLPERIA